jgi:hypothetical protein
MQIFIHQNDPSLVKGKCFTNIELQIKIAKL